MGYASDLDEQCPLIGVFNGALGEPEPWDMVLDIRNTLQEIVYNLPYETITTMDAFQASQQAYRLSIAPKGTNSK